MKRLELDIGRLLERDSELSAVEQSIESALSGSGEFILATGAPGVGKSAFLSAALGMASEAGMGVRLARGGELEKDFPFGIVRQLLEDAPAHLEGEIAPARRVFDPGAFPVLEASTQSVLRALYWVVVALAEEAPIALVVDDAQWADLASLRFFDYLARRVDDLPVLVVLGARGSDPPSEPQVRALRSLGLARILELRELSPAATGELLSQQLGTKADPAFGEAVYELTGGNPFLIGEVSRELIRLTIEPEVSSIARVRELTPRLVEQDVGLRLQRLGHDCVASAHAMAVLGDGTPVRLVARLLGFEPDRVVQAADRLVDAGILVRHRPPGFRHPILRSACLASIPAARRSGLHQRAARILLDEGADPSRVAAHYLEVEPRGDAAVHFLLRSAAKDSIGRGSPESAVTFLRRALEEIDGGLAERPAVRLELGLALSSLDPEAAAGVLVAVAGETHDPEIRARAATEAGYALCTLGRVREARDVVYGHLHHFDYHGESAVRQLARMAAELEWTVGDSFERAVESARRYWTWAEGVSEESGIVAGGRAYVECATLGDLATARRLAVEAMQGDTLVHFLRPGDYGAMGTVVALIACDELVRARDLCSQLLGAARRSGERTAIANCSIWSAWAQMSYGDLFEAEVHAETALAAAKETGQNIGVPMATLAAVLIERGDVAQAVARFEEAGLALDGDLEDRQATTVLIGRAGVRLAAGRIAEAVRDLDRLDQESQTQGDRNPLLSWRALRVMGLMATGRAVDAAETASDNLQRARRWGAARSVSSALRVRSLVESDPSERISLLRNAHEIIRDSEGSLEQAKVHVALGSELRRLGERTEARDLLRSGHDLAYKCGANSLAQFALAELVAAGAKPRRTLAVGPESLTASERRVAQMAVHGMTNREIAEALFVSAKTVAFHLTNCYRKLGISTREELERILDGL